MGVSIPEGKKMEDIVTNLGRIADNIAWLSGNYDLSDYKEITAAVRNGDGARIPNGHCFVVPHAEYGDIDFVVRRKNVDKVADDPERPTLTIQAKYLLSLNAGSIARTFEYDRREAFKKVIENIPAGTVCKFTLPTTYVYWLAGTYHFVATDEIAPGKMLCMSDSASKTLTTLQVRVFDTQKMTTYSASYNIIAGDGNATVDLGVWGTNCNDAARVAYGSNNEAQSGLFQLLNGDSGSAYMNSIWVPKTEYDMMISEFTSRKGFLGGFPQEFRACLGFCAIHNITNNVYEDTGFATNDEYSHNGYFWLPSRKEIYGTNENAKEESEIQIPYYAYIGTTNADKLGYAKGATDPMNEWLRTPRADSARSARIVSVSSGGGLGDNLAATSFGIRPLAILT